MFCPKCGSKTKVLNTRYNKLEGEEYRSRRCEFPGCSHKFYTVEFVAEATDEFMLTWDKAANLRHKRGNKNE